MNLKRESFYADLLRKILSGMVQWPSKLKIEEVDTPQTVLIGVSCHGDDHGQVIGRGAGHIRALQEIFRAIGMRKRQIVEISVAESVTRPPVNRPNAHSDASWDSERDKTLVELSKSILGPILRESYEVTPIPAGNKTVLVVRLQEAIPDSLFKSIACILLGWGAVNGRKVEMQLHGKNDHQNP